MSVVHYLNQQAARAERLAQGMDGLTIERLLAMSRDYRQQAARMSDLLACIGMHELADCGERARVD